jgi:hypothetical protein
VTTVGISRALEQARAPQRDSLDVVLDVRPLLGELRRAGWTDDSFKRHGFAGCEGAHPNADYTRFWRTTGEIARVMNAAGQIPVIVKSWRVYAFVDGNVDLITPVAEWGRELSRLAADAWVMPSSGSAAKQQLVEPRKLKLPPRREDLLPAHVYAGLRWRYQPAFEMVALSEDAFFTTSCASILSTSDAWGSATFRSPSLELELVLQALHVFEENYRVSLGECMHIESIARSRTLDAGRVRAIEAQLGVVGASDMLVDGVRAALEDYEAAPNERHLRALPLGEVARYSTQRAQGLARRGSVVGAAVMLASAVAWCGAATLYRRFRGASGPTGRRVSPETR